MPAFDALRDQANPLAEVVDAASLGQQAQVEQREKLDSLLTRGYDHCAELISLYNALQNATPLPDFAERMCQMLSRQLNISKAITDNLSELTREYVESTPYLGLSEKALQASVLNERSQWYSFLERFGDLTRRAITYVRRHEHTVQRIEKFPGLGARVLEQHQPAVNTLQSVLELWSSLALCELGLAMEPFKTDPVLAMQVHTALEPLVIHASSHADLALDTSLSAEEKTGVLDTAIDHYQRVEDALQLLKETLPAEQFNEAMQRLGDLTVTLREDAQARLELLIRSTTAPVPAPSQRRPRPGRPARRKPGARPTSVQVERPEQGAEGSGGEQSTSSVADDSSTQLIHTADGEAVMAQVRYDALRQHRVAEVIAYRHVVATWHEAPTGVWSRPAVTPPRPTPQPQLQLATLIRDADTLSEAAEAEIRGVARLKQVTRVPVDLEDLYHGTARRLEALAESIEEALTQLNATDAITPEHGSAELKAQALRALSARAREVGTVARVDLCKSLPPTGGRLAFLVEAGEATIQRLGQRTPLGKKGRRDFVQEYEIRDRRHHVLWYAHFHYDTATAGPTAYTAAHLKTLTQRFDGYQKQLEQARSNEEVIGIYRSRIDPALATRLFLSLP